VRLLRLAVVGLLLTGCGAGSSGAGGDVPVTPRSLAVVAVERTDDPSSGRASPPDDRRPGVVASADLRYGADGEDDGALLQVSVRRSPVPASLRCGTYEARYVALYDGCETTELGTLLWKLEETEEDPGQVVVVVAKGDVHAEVSTSGTAITGDPRSRTCRSPSTRCSTS
jgi:hypothetical protein